MNERVTNISVILEIMLWFYLAYFLIQPWNEFLATPLQMRYFTHSTLDQGKAYTKD